MLALPVPEAFPLASMVPDSSYSTSLNVHSTSNGVSALTGVGGISAQAIGVGNHPHWM